MAEEKQKVVIIGGGIAGLTSAFYLQKKIKENQLPIDIQLIEASHRLGGKLQTVRRDGFTIERGPDSFLARKTSMIRLAKEVGMDDQLVHNSTGKSYVLVNNKLHPMPGGSIMGIPTEIGPFITTGLFSIPGKLRAAADFLLPRSEAGKDQALGQFFRRRLGNEVVENLIEPLLSGIYAGDIDQLSLMSTFPQFYEVEQKYRSLIIGMKKSTPNQAKQPVQNKPTKGAFLTFKTGLQSFAEAIEAKLDPHSILKGHRVEKITRTNGKYRIFLNNGEEMTADCVIAATPHQITQSMFSDYRFFDPLKAVPSTSVATVAMAFPKEAIKKDIDGTGFVVSRNSDYSITACTWTHKKWAHSTPEGKVLLRCYVGRAGDETIVDLSDDQINKIVLDDLKKTMDITMNPDFSIISRWKNAMPQYTVGHKQRLATILEKMGQELPGVFLAGASYGGVGVPDCIDQGEAAVKGVLEYLNVKEAVTM
ncbi:protoporphyrinogen oxidase [Neobacillus thermocopriae]|uniref:Coproporphyrinogen III oxidase n=1 Tax=Neobacillus thermocopriae TaxID=1215031 RepID=A0A6B3TQV5_9BACI|nr:protoporphyrinogen oxidase [Neobacillus thermocopriae]MED3623056.1 protoporphyrinogen oxidase [Neobacillus thermocopriae]MED3714951.1 protoporphyrinogen oxidase [Neobacillus thermocopriae]NEX78806.1 protoporphyrinogen oxidase [Neobacillus thermocopriae]